MSPLYRDIFDLSWYFLSNLWLYRCVFDTGPEADANINKNNNNNNEPWQRYPLPECHFTLCMFAQQAKTVSVTRQHAGLGSTNGWLKPGWLSSSSGEKNTNRLEEHICEFSQHRRVCGCLYGKINTEILVRRLTEFTLFKTCGWKKIKEAKEGRRKGYGIDMRIYCIHMGQNGWHPNIQPGWYLKWRYMCLLDDMTGFQKTLQALPAFISSCHTSPGQHITVYMDVMLWHVLDVELALWL